ncbi:MAG: ABC transporter ATP-binding protein [Tepidisphaeraceae bacterium]
MPDTPRGQYGRRFLAYVFEYKLLFACAIAAGIAKFTFNYSFPWLIGNAVDTVFDNKHHLNTAARNHALIGFVVIGLLLSIGHGITSFLRGNLAARLGGRIIRDVRNDLLEHLHRLSLHFYGKERTGSIVSRVITDIQTASQIVNSGLINIAIDGFSTIYGLYILFSISWKLTLATLVVLPLYSLLFRGLNPRVKEASRLVQSQLSKISGTVQERLAAIALVKTHAAEEREQERFRGETDVHYERTVTQNTLAQMVGAVSEVLVHLGQTIVIGYGGYLAIKGELSTGDAVHFMGALAVMYLPIRRFAEINIVWQTSLSAIERVFKVFEITPKIVDKPDAPKVKIERGEITFDHVTFSYADDSAESTTSLEEHSPFAEHLQQNRRTVLNDVSLTIAPGEKVALVGPSGAGKTTFVTLLPRLYDVTGGAIRIDGRDIRDYRLRKLRKGIAIVQQESLLFSGTIRENLTYGRPTATEAELLAAAKAANAHEFITQLPGGYEAMLGERGVNLSGGQKQRLSIARAILKDPRILILDEATSALDSESESLVQEALSHLMQGRTCLIIAHRLSTVRDADRIVVMQQGQIVEIGKHDDLVARDGVYARLVRRQFRTQESEDELDSEEPLSLDLKPLQ